jgi:hypothetical protein
MRSITTAAAFAIAASLAAGQESGKSGKGSKSGECTSCSADTLTRANLMTNLVLDYWRNEGVIDSASIEETCAATDALQEAEFAQALEYTAGCLASPAKCMVDFIMSEIKVFNATISAGELQVVLLELLCFFEAEGGGFSAPEEECASINPCNDGPTLPQINALALEDGGKTFDIKSSLETILGSFN